MLQDEMKPTPSASIEEARAADLRGIVAVHQAAFKGFFLDRMGPAFLRAYYGAILGYDAAILLVHRDSVGEIDGFAAGFLEPDRFYAHFRAQRIRMLPAIAIALLRRPGLLVEIMRNTRRVDQAAATRVAAAELASIGTSRRGTGVGSTLLRAFCERSALHGAKEVILTTDRDGNETVVRFYLNHGFKQHGIEMRGSRALHAMVRQLDN